MAFSFLPFGGKYLPSVSMFSLSDIVINVGSQKPGSHFKITVNFFNGSLTAFGMTLFRELEWRCNEFVRDLFNLEIAITTVGNSKRPTVFIFAI